MGFWSSLCCGFDGGAIFILVQAPHGGKMATNNPESPCFFLQTQGRRALEVPLEEWKIFPQASRNLSSVSHWPEVGCMSIPEAGILAENTVELLSRTLTPCPPLARSGGGVGSSSQWSAPGRCVYSTKNSRKLLKEGEMNVERITTN